MFIPQKIVSIGIHPYPYGHDPELPQVQVLDILRSGGVLLAYQVFDDLPGTATVSGLLPKIHPKWPNYMAWIHIDT